MIAESLQSLPLEVQSEIPKKAALAHRKYGRGILQIVEKIKLDQPSDWVFAFLKLEVYENMHIGLEYPNNLNCVRTYNPDRECVIGRIVQSPADSEYGRIAAFDVIHLETLESLMQ